MLDKLSGVILLVIGETLRRDVSKIVLRVTDDKKKFACGNLKL